MHHVKTRLRTLSFQQVSADFKTHSNMSACKQYILLKLLTSPLCFVFWQVTLKSTSPFLEINENILTVFSKISFWKIDLVSCVLLMPTLVRDWCNVRMNVVLDFTSSICVYFIMVELYEFYSRVWTNVPILPNQLWIIRELRLNIHGRESHAENISIKGIVWFP